MISGVSSSIFRGAASTRSYAPDFNVEIEGEELDPETKGDVLDLKVTMEKDASASVDVTFSNWDDKNLFFKYSDTDTLNIGSQVHVRMGYAGGLVSVMRGSIQGLTPRFPQSGSPTIVVSAQDDMQVLKHRRPTRGEEVQYLEKADWQIAQAVAERNGLRAEVTREGPVHAEVIQKDQDDAQFLMERAKRIDFDCFMRTDPDSGQAVLYFVKPMDARGGGRSRSYDLGWFQTTQVFSGDAPRGTDLHPLLSFEPRLSMSRQVGELTVRGWDSAKKEPIVASATVSDLPNEGAGTSGPRAAQAAAGERKDVVVDAVVTSEQEARELAVSLLRERAYQFLTASGEVEGLPELRPGDNVNLWGLGTRFSGAYYVTKVQHSLGAGGFLTRFESRRVSDGGLRANGGRP